MLRDLELCTRVLALIRPCFLELQIKKNIKEGITTNDQINHYLL